MALKDQYTWKDFLKANPDKKELKRTSAEGKKAFEAAYKTFAKEYLKNREARTAKFVKSMTEEKDNLVEKLKSVPHRGWKTKSKILNQKIGKKEAAIAKFNKLLERSKAASKNF